MRLEDLITSTMATTRAKLSGAERRITDTLREGTLKGYFRDEDPRREQYERLLEQCVAQSAAKYRNTLKGASRKSAKIAGVLTGLFDAYELASTYPIPAAYAGPLHAGLSLTKTILEVPALARYVSVSHDVGGAAKWIGYRALDLAVPLLGPIIGHNALERIVRSRIAKEATREFLTTIGRYQPLDELIEARVRERAGSTLTPAYARAGAYAKI